MTIMKRYKGRIPSCGVFCGGCPTYTRDRNPCPGAEINVKRCEGCKTFHLCCVEREISYCYECKEFPCKKFRDFSRRWMKHGQNFVENQKLLKEVGPKKFLKICNSKVENSDV